MASISSFAGAVMRTFFAPALRCFSAPARFVKKPVASITRSIFRSFHGRSSGSRSEKTL